MTGIRNSSGALQATIRYSAYGEQWTDNQALVDKLAATFNGARGVMSLGGGMYWMQHRFYSAQQGRFVSVDSVESSIGSLQSAYNYADGDPVNRMDPTGLASSCSNRSTRVNQYKVGNEWRTVGQMKCTGDIKTRTVWIDMYYLNTGYDVARLLWTGERSLAWTRRWGGGAIQEFRYNWTADQEATFTSLCTSWDKWMPIMKWKTGSGSTVYQKRHSGYFITSC